jgi:hypothetical protein
MKHHIIGLVALSFPLVAGCVAEDVDEFAPMTDEAEEIGVTSAALSEQPNVNDIYIQKIIASGSGCRPEDDPVTSVIGPDGRSFIVIMPGMALNYSPPGALIQNKSCVAVLNLHVPQGIQVSVATVNTSGFASLGKWHSAAQYSRYFFAGQPLGSTFRTALVGPHDDVYRFTDQVAFASLIWSPCGASRDFAINTTVNLNTSYNRSQPAFISNDTLDGEFRKELHIQWRSCNG